MEIGYWNNIYSIPFELLSFLIFFYLSISICKFKTIRLFIEIGKHTYFILFIHMQIGNGIVNRVLDILKLDISNYLKPILVVILSYIIWYFINKAFEITKINKFSFIFVV